MNKRQNRDKFLFNLLEDILLSSEYCGIGHKQLAMAAEISPDTLKEALSSEAALEQLTIRDLFNIVSTFNSVNKEPFCLEVRFAPKAAVKEPCPFCKKGKLEEKVESVGVMYKGYIESRPTLYSVCDHCLVETATDDQMRKNKQDTEAFHRQVDEMIDDDN